MENKFRDNGALSDGVAEQWAKQLKECRDKGYREGYAEGYLLGRLQVLIARIAANRFGEDGTAWLHGYLAHVEELNSTFRIGLLVSECQSAAEFEQRVRADPSLQHK